MQEQLEKWFNFITDGHENEYYFLNLIARPKYLPTEERGDLKANMLNMQLYKHTGDYPAVDDYKKLIMRYATAPETYLTRSGKPIPKEARAIYGGINPIDMIAATAQFKKDLASLEEKCLRNDLDFATEYSNLRRIIEKQWLKYPLVKHNVDFDVDIDLQNEEVKQVLVSTLRMLENEGTPEQLSDLLFVFTRGGFHLLSHKKHMSREWNTNTLLYTLRRNLGDYAKEVVQNKNNMTPVPSTMQCDFEVYCLNFNEVKKKYGVK